MQPLRTSFLFGISFAFFPRSEALESHPQERRNSGMSDYFTKQNKHITIDEKSEPKENLECIKRVGNSCGYCSTRPFKHR